MNSGPAALCVTCRGRRWIFAGDRVVTVGRDPGADVHVDDELVSRHHAILRAEPGGWLLEDGGSRNGTFVAGNRVDTVSVGAATQVALGHPQEGPVLELSTAADVPGDGGAGSRREDPATSADRGSPPGEELGRLAGIHSVRRLVRIGRSPENDIVLDDLQVSRRHAELHWEAESGFELVDVGSHNGTFVNGRRAVRARLHPLDVVGVGRHRFRLVGEVLEVYEDTGDVTFSASGLTVRTAGGEVILADASLSLRERSLLAVVGPSGSGKSTLLKALTGLRPAQEGTVLYGGRDLYASYDELRGRIGLVPQDDTLHQELTVEASLRYASELRFPADVARDERADRVEAVLAELNLAERRAVRIRRLSGGQRKRASVALELLTKPSLLFLDEPTSGLDPGLERSLMETLRRLADTGRTVVVVTHSVESLRLCDRVLFLSSGGQTAYFGPAQLALAYFDAEDFQDVFRALSAEGADWSERFRNHPDRQEYADGAPAHADPSASSEPSRPPRRRGALRQFGTLTRRYVAVLASDRRNLGLLLLQAPVLGALMLVALPSEELADTPAGEIRLLSRAALVLLVIVMAATWLGASNAVREIVKELPIYRRERAIGLSIPAYVGSKAVVLGALTAAQAVVLVALATARQGGPADALLLGSPRAELMAVAVLTGLAGMSLGLLISALASRVDRAMAVLPIVLLVELVLAMGAVFPEVAERPVLRQTGYLAGTQWGFAAAAATVNLNDLQRLNNIARELPVIDLDDPEGTLESVGRLAEDVARWEHSRGAWAIDVGALVALIVLPLVLTGVALARVRRDGPG